jgi:regulator of sirC expression with transglutaminase-like and TPR domain
MDYSESLKKINDWIISEVTQDNEKHIHVPLMVLNLESIEFQGLDIIETLGKISGITREVKELNSSFDTFYDIIQNVNHVLFEIHGIHGNTSDYHNPKNSFLNKVLETKSGNPVSISIIYQEICRQLGFHLTGIGIPGHYLLKYGKKESLIFLSPYDKGVLLTKKEVLQISNKKNRKNNTNIKILDSNIEEFGPRKTILRVLNNLKYSYSSVKEFEKALCISNIILKIQPKNLQNLIHLISLHKEIGNFSDALELLDNFIEKSPEYNPITVNLINIRKKLFNKQ